MAETEPWGARYTRQRLCQAVIPPEYDGDMVLTKEFFAARGNQSPLSAFPAIFLTAGPKKAGDPYETASTVVWCLRGELR